MFKPIIIGLGYTLVPKSRKPQWLKETLEASGPTYIKLGQFIANRKDIFGQDLSDGLKSLQNHVKPVPWSSLEPYIPKDTFTMIDTVPVATASIAQIHRAQLKNGRLVALKIKKPGVEESVRDDIRALRLTLSYVLQKSFIDDFERSMLKEFDFESEIINLKDFGDMYDGSTRVIVPRVYPEYSSKSLITMDFVDSDGTIRKAKDLIQIFINQLLYENRVHGDLHSGNIGTNGESTVLYDFGNVIRTTKQYRSAMRDFVYNLQVKNKNGVLRAMKMMGMKIVNEKMTDMFIDKFFKYVETLDISSFTFDPDEIQDKIPIQLDSTTVSLMRSYSLLEGYCKKIDPDFSYSEILTETLETLYLDLDYISTRARQDIAQVLRGMSESVDDT